MPKTSVSKITTKGQVTIPEEIRERLYLQTGDRIEWKACDGGAVEVRKVGRDFHELIGMLHRPGMKPLAVEQLDESIAQHLRRKHRVRR